MVGDRHVVLFWHQDYETVFEYDFMLNLNISSQIPISNLEFEYENILEMFGSLGVRF